MDHLVEHGVRQLNDIASHRMPLSARPMLRRKTNLF
jgi:hypothetical protein